MGDVHEAAATGFTRGAEAYASARPGYPKGVFDLLRDELGLRPGCEVLDLAAGTGKLTVGLVETGAVVTAVEPLDAMRARLVEQLPTVEALAGTAEAIPLSDASVDLVTVAQAFHWFDAGRALGEVARVVRPGGGVALIWNVRDESVDWVRRFGEIQTAAVEELPYDRHADPDRWVELLEGAGRFRETGTAARALDAHGEALAGAGWFGPVTRSSFAHSVPTSPGGLVERAASVSFVAALPDEQRVLVLDAIRDLATTHPDLAGRSSFGFPYETNVYWCRRI